MPLVDDSPARAAVDPHGTAGVASESQGLLDGTPYRALHLLGCGGMGEVVAAEHRALGKQVVVKLLHARHADDVHLADRMRVEAQALARLSHKNLVAVHDFGRTAGGRPYYVMERLQGRTLREELEARGALPILEALRHARQALAGLGVAHEAGLVHRDVKLDNLFVCDPREDGAPRELKVLDFGVAKVLAAREPHAPAPTELPTREGLALGTPRFFSPEQACAAPVDARSDIYALGVVLYTLVAGRGPFDHLRDLVELVRAHVLETPAPPSRWAPRQVPAAVDVAILRAMAKRPEDRFPSAAAFAEVLAAIERDLAGAAPYAATEPPPAPEAAQKPWLTTLPLSGVSLSTPHPHADATLALPAGPGAVSSILAWPDVERVGRSTEPLPSAPASALASSTPRALSSAAGAHTAPRLYEAALSWGLIALSAVVFGTVAAAAVRCSMTP